MVALGWGGRWECSLMGQTLGADELELEQDGGGGCTSLSSLKVIGLCTQNRSMQIRPRCTRHAACLRLRLVDSDFIALWSQRLVCVVPLRRAWDGVQLPLTQKWTGVATALGLGFRHSVHLSWFCPQGVFLTQLSFLTSANLFNTNIAVSIFLWLICLVFQFVKYLS